MAELLTLPAFTLESGKTLTEVPVAYDTWGTLNAHCDNAILVFHALTGSSDAADWWGPLIGPGQALDTDRFFVICPNNIGSPYGTLSPLTLNPMTGQPYGGHFPEATIRDTARLHRQLVEKLGVRQVAMVIGGSMGGMLALEWAFFGNFVRTVVPIAVGGQHSAWCIGWSEAQRQAIYADPRWQDGHYAEEEPPSDGLSTARMIAMISYRAPVEFSVRFGRERMPANGTDRAPFSVESYLRYQGKKLVARFDANCYVHLTRQMDTHDIARDRGAYPDVLAQIQQPTLVIGVPTDILYPFEEQEELTQHIPNAELRRLTTPYGHDSFLIDFEGLDRHIRPFIAQHLPEHMMMPGG